MTSGVQTDTSLDGTEQVIIDNGGAVLVQATTQRIANLGSSGGTATASIVGTETIGLQTAAGVQEKISSSLLMSFVPSFTVSTMTNSTSITLSQVFTALSLTQTSTGNTVNLKAAPVNYEIQGFSITNNITNLTVSSAANTVKNGAATATTAAGGSFWWIFLTDTWWRYTGDPLSQ